MGQAGIRLDLILYKLGILWVKAFNVKERDLLKKLLGGTVLALSLFSF